MSLINCTDCGKLHIRKNNVSKFCKECSEKYEQRFRFFKDQLAENRGMTLQELSEKTGISIKVIMEWVREGRIHIS